MSLQTSFVGACRTFAALTRWRSGYTRTCFHKKGAIMGQAYRPQPTALIVGQDLAQRELLSVLLEECDLKVIQCESAEAASVVMAAVGESVLILFTNIDLPGTGNGDDLADLVSRRWPHVHVVALGADRSATGTGTRMPRHVTCLTRPRPLDILIETGKAVDAPPSGVRH
jgi:CheY-like chemotaxis protein